MNMKLEKYFPIFVLPALLAFIIAFAVPFVAGFLLSFTRFNTVSDAVWNGVDNYIYVFMQDKDFLIALMFTIKFVIVLVLSVNLFGFLLALALTRGLKGTNFFRTLFFMPNLIGGIVLGYIWQIIINGVLLKYNLDITANAKYGFWGLVIVMNWQLIGYVMVIYVAGLQGVSDELKEAAMIDGASPLKILLSVTVPNMVASFTICIFLTLTNAFKLFDQNLALTAGAPAKQTSLLALDIYNTFYSRAGFEGIGQAKAVLFFLLVASIAFLQIKITKNKEIES